MVLRAAKGERWAFSGRSETARSSAYLEMCRCLSLDKRTRRAYLDKDAPLSPFFYKSTRRSRNVVLAGSLREGRLG